MNEFLDGERRRGPLLIGVGLLLVIAVVLSVVGTLLVTGEDDPTGSPPRSSAPSVSATPTPSSVGTGRGVMKLVRGRTLVSGVSVGYPHTVVGAVSAAVEFWSQIGSTLDPDRAAAIGRLVADKSWPDAPDDFAEGPVNTRRRLGLPARGDVSGSSIVVEPSAYQLRNTLKNRVTVLLLGYLTTTTPTEGSQTRIGVFPVDLHWSGQDWKIEEGKGVDYSDLREQPGSSAADAAGWLEFER